MYTPIYTKKFRKSLKKFQGSGVFKNKELQGIMHKLADEKILEPKYRDHELSGEYSGCRECHIKNDILLVYELDKKNSLITFANLGTHSELF
jgi:mRNA interferase YafQ